jgi:hypothetical protein
MQVRLAAGFELPAPKMWWGANQDACKTLTSLCCGFATAARRRNAFRVLWTMAHLLPILAWRNLLQPALCPRLAFALSTR